MKDLGHSFGIFDKWFLSQFIALIIPRVRISYISIYHRLSFLVKSINVMKAYPPDSLSWTFQRS